jgi:imidazolonepropionase-like amidohydrolase
MILIFAHGNLIDGQAGAALADSLVVVEDDKIAFAGPWQEGVYQKYSVSAGAVIHDIAGKTILPGLIDSHVHLSLYAKPSPVMDMLMDTGTYTAIKAADNAKKLLMSGFTTVRCCGDKAEADFAVKRAVGEGLIEGPRILASGKAISITGGHGDFLPGDLMTDGIGVICDGEDEVRRCVRRMLKNNADNIKVMATGGGTSPGPGTVAQLSINEMRVAVEEAAKRNAVTAAHAIGTEGINNALKAGIKTIEHGTFLNDESIDLFLKTDAYLVPTLTAFRTIKYGSEGGVPPHVLDKVRYYATEHTKNLQKALKAGVRVICGTDTGTPFNAHGDGMEEFELYTKNGMTPMEAIKAGSSAAAEALNQSDIGILAAGKTADILVVSGDPLKDIALLQKADKLLVIMRNGKFVKCAL